MARAVSNMNFELIQGGVENSELARYQQQQARTASRFGRETGPVHAQQLARHH
jgi:hypothetical protein